MALHPGEQVVAVMYPWWATTVAAYLVTLGLWEVWRRRHFFALTDQRLLYGKGILISKTQRSIPLARVQDATYDRKLWGGGVQVSSAGGDFGEINDTSYRPMEAKEFARLLNERIRQANDGVAGTSGAGGQGASDQLRQLQALKDDGLITAEEFASKRQDILGRL